MREIMARIARFLKRNKGSEGPSNLIFVAIERQDDATDSNAISRRSSLKFWYAVSCRLEAGVISRRVDKRGETAEDFWCFVESRSSVQRPTWIFASEMGIVATLLGFWEKLDSRWFTIDPIYGTGVNADGTKQVRWRGRLCVDTRTTFIVCRHGSKTYKLVDVGNYWPNVFNVIKDNADLSRLPEPSPESPDREYMAHAERDANILLHLVTEMIITWVKEKCGVFQMTAAMLAMTNFRHTCEVRRADTDSLDIAMNPDGPEHELEREAYYGGRVQPYFVGERKGKFYHLDVNSLYPFVMKFNNYPRRFAGYDYGPSTDDLRSKLRVYGCVAEVFITSQHHTYPVRIDGEQYHCTGNYWTVLCGPELQRAIDSECVSRIGRVQYYSVAPLFYGWVDYWYDRKLSARKANPPRPGEVELCKLILCSLSGKWAQRGRHWIDVPGKIPLERWGGWSEQDELNGPWHQYRGIGGNCQKLTDLGEPDHAFPAISAFITSHGREYMRGIISDLPADSVYYMATDSLICDSDAYDQLLYNGFVSDTQLGKFKVQGMADSIGINGANHYSFGGKLTVAGLLGLAKKTASGRNVVRLWEGIQSVISSGPVDTITLSDVTVDDYRPDRRGIITQSGWWMPFRLSDDPDFSDKPPKGGYDSDLFSTARVLNPS